MSVRLKGSRALSALSLTSLIDVVFLLLVFFLVATRFEEEERSMAIQTPTASEAVPLTTRPRELMVNIDKEGRYQVGRQYVELAELQTMLHQAAANNPGRQKVRIRADGRAPVQKAVNVMNACNRAQIRDYELAVAPDRP